MACCVIDDAAWCSGSGSPSHSYRMYRWAGPGSLWIRQPDLPGSIMLHSMVCDEANMAIWALARYYTSCVFMYSVDDRSWHIKGPLPQRRAYTESVLCGGKYIITPGGDTESGTAATILLTDTTTGKQSSLIQHYQPLSGITLLLT